MKKAKQYVLFGRSTIGRLRILAYKTRHSQLIKVLVAIFFVAILAAIGVTLLESQSNAQFKNLSNGLWWAVVTMATVGYGDIVPITPAGRLVAGIVIMSGVTLFSVFTAAVSSRVITNRLKEGKGLSKSSAKNHIAILGWNPSGENIIEAIRDEAIRENRSIVLVNRMNPDDAAQVINKYRDLHIQFVYGDFGDETVRLFCQMSRMDPSQNQTSAPSSARFRLRRLSRESKSLPISSTLSMKRIYAGRTRIRW